MKFNYVCKDVSLTSAMKEACEAKLAKFDHYFSSGEVKCTVTITILPQTKVVEVFMQSGTVAFRAKSTHEDFYCALDLVIAKLEGQLRKMKTQMLKATKHRSFAQEVMLDEIEQGYDEENLEIVKKKTLSLAPMDIDEALCRMDALGHSFFIFLNSETGLVNVLYEREDHGYGVIEIEK